MRFLSGLIAGFFLLVGTFWADEGHHHALSEEEVGSVQFATSCSPQVSATFNRAVALLHSFQYQRTRETLLEIAKQDPTCAMAQWGIAMSHYHGLWDNGDMAAGRLAQRRAESMLTEDPQITAREKAYIEALGEIYREDGKDSYAHGQAFEQKI